MTKIPEAALKLVYKPEQYDDWGTIRTEDGEFFTKIWFPRTHTNEELAEHRKNGTDPYEAAARMVVDSVNRALLAAPVAPNNSVKVDDE